MCIAEATAFLDMVKVCTDNPFGTKGPHIGPTPCMRAQRTEQPGQFKLSGLFGVVFKYRRSAPAVPGVGR